MALQPPNPCCRLAAALLLLALILGGCVTGGKDPRVTAVQPLAQQSFCRVIVLPFQNDTDYPQGGAIATRVFQQALFNRAGIDAMPEGDVRRLLTELRLGPHGEPDQEQRRIIASRLEADVLVLGRVTTMATEKQASGDNEPVVALQVRLQNARDGRLLTASYHRRQGGDYRKILHFGAVDTVADLTRLVSEEIIDSWREQGLHPCP